MNERGFSIHESAVPLEGADARIPGRRLVDAGER